MTLIWIFIQIIIGYHLVMPLSLFIACQLKYRLVACRRRSVDSTTRPPFYDYAIIVTAYEDTSMLQHAVGSLLRLDYERFLVYVVADKCDISSLNFDDERVILLKPGRVLANNIKSHQYAISNFRRDHDKIAIIDSDNVVDRQFLVELNKVFYQGFEAVQGFRAAKNINTDYARLDAARDLFYHFYDGKLLFDIGSSATLAGSGMAFDTSLYTSCVAGAEVRGAGFDKLLQARIVASGRRIGFSDSAIVFDQKTAHSSQLVGQRARWINSWFKYFSLGFGLIWHGITKMKINQGLFGLVLLRPPLFMFLILAVICLTINVTANLGGGLYWIIGLWTFITSFFIALVAQRAKSPIYLSLLKIPIFVFFQTLSLLNIRRFVKQSVATKHVQERLADSGLPE